jgi:hypothetical protein
MPKRLSNPYLPEADEVETDQPTKHGDLIWGRQPGEPNLWFDRFTRYREQGARRSLYAIYLAEPAKAGSKREQRDDPRPRGGVPGSWAKQAARWRWDERAEAWDQYERDQAAVEFEKFRVELRKKELETSAKLIAKAQEMLVYALAVKTTETKAGPDGRMTVTNVVKPVRWSMGDAARLLKAGSEIGRLAAGLPTSIEEYRSAPTQAQELSDHELAAIAARGAGDAIPNDPDAGIQHDATDTRASGTDSTGAA